MRSTFLAAALLASYTYLFSQTRNELDSLNQLCRNYICVDTITFDSLSSSIIESAKANEYFSQWGQAMAYKGYAKICIGQFKSAIPILKGSIALYEREKDVNGKIKSLSYLIACHNSLSQADSSLYYNKLQLDLAKSIADSLLIATASLAKAGIHTGLAQNDSIVASALLGLKYLGDSDNNNLRAGLNTSLGNAYYQNEDYETALKYFLIAKRFYESFSSPSISLIYNNLGVCFSKLSVPDSSFYYFEKSIELNKKNNQTYYLAYNYQGIAEAYNEVGDCDNAIRYNLLSKSLSENLGEKRSLAGVLSNLTKCYVKTGDLNKAIESAKSAIALTEETGDMDKQADAYFLLSEAYRAQGKYKEAYQAHKSFYSLDSLLLNRDKQTTIASLETEYQTEKKEAEIASLSQQASIQALEIQQKNQTIIIGLIAVVFVLAAIYFLVKQREAKRKQSQTELEQRFLRSQLNPHFISNALVAVQSFMLKNDAESAALYLTKFSKLMREILENSRKEFIPVEEEINMLKNYLDIHKLRLGSFDFVIEMDENIDPEVDTIPPMFVQPFVENAIEHGLSNQSKEGKIELKFKKVGDYISIEVADNGKGLYSKEKVDDHVSLSTTIIKERMELFNKSLRNKIQLVIANLKNENGEISGTRVELMVPFS
jgi:tetratricopeptide (TPR) repeat protein